MQKFIISALSAVAALGALATTASAEEAAGKCGVNRYFEEEVQACLDARLSPGNRAVAIEEERPVIVIDNGYTSVVTPVEIKRY